MQTTTKKRTPFKKKERATPIDEHVGQRLRERRLVMGMTQSTLAQSSGLTFQQIQKYEQGKNRVSASRLHQFCQILDVPVSYFFDEIPSSNDTGVARALGESSQDSFEGASVANKKETRELIRTYYSIQDPKIRKNMLKLMKQMAANFLEQQGE